jgi:DNA mismatch endonuclease (patch repair protein)
MCRHLWLEIGLSRFNVARIEPSRKRPRLISPPASSEAVAAVMRANKKRDSGPELLVRRLLYSEGYRYRLHASDLPGNPDVVFRSRRKVIFVHGCFWHQHQDRSCPLQSHPKTNVHYWKPKLRRNRQRDRASEQRIAEMGWSAFVVWECEVRQPEVLKKKLRAFLAKCSE